jgi:hypothetical protein
LLGITKTVGIQASEEATDVATIGAMLGFALMMTLDVALG